MCRSLTHKDLRRDMEKKLNLERKSLDEIKDKLKALYEEVMKEDAEGGEEEEEEEEGSEEEVEVGDGEKRKKKKKKRGGPKGAKSAYIIFSTDMRAKVNIISNGNCIHNLYM
jgi:hypothetical protein